MKIALITTDNRDEFRRYADPAPYFGPPITALLDGLADKKDCEVHVVSCVQKPVVSPPKLAENIFYHSLVVGKWGWMRSAYIGCLWAVRRKLGQIQPDIVHAQGTERYCANAAVGSGFPNVTTIHGNMRSVARRLNARIASHLWLTARLERVALARTRGVLCNSAYTQGLVRPVAQATWLVPNALLKDFFSPRTAMAKSTPPVLINVANIAPYKRQVQLLELGSRLHSAGHRFELQFVGRCNEGSAYGRDFLARLQPAEVSHYARHLGQRSPREVVQLLDAASAMIHIPVEEAFGLAVAEGLSRNLKLFATRAGGIVDIASDAEAAELFHELDWTGLQTSIERWLGTGCPQPRAASALMRDRYHQDVIVRRHLEIYREVLGR